VPSFTAGIPNIRAIGPVVQIQIAISEAAEQALKKAGQPVPPPVQVSAMIDTGASDSVIQTGIAQQLGIQPIGVTRVNTPSSTNVQCYRYDVQLILPNGVTVVVPVTEAPLQGQHIQCLIGRDILMHGVFIYIGYSNLFSFSV